MTKRFRTKALMDYKQQPHAKHVTSSEPSTVCDTNATGLVRQGSGKHSPFQTQEAAPDLRLPVSCQVHRAFLRGRIRHDACGERGLAVSVTTAGNSRMLVSISSLQQAARDMCRR